jgi:hypothetical protein
VVPVLPDHDGLPGDTPERRLVEGAHRGHAPEKKVGRKVVMELSDDSEGFAYYLEILPRVEVTLKMLKRFRDNVHEALGEMDSDKRKSLGYGKRRSGARSSARARCGGSTP